jgi:predicted Fe-Mo cluster-binding NifX family protein
LKIAIPDDNGNISPHFGRCPSFTVIELKDKKIVSRELIESPGHNPGMLPDYFSKLNIETVVAGGMGMRARELFAQKNIDIILGADGSVDDIINKLVKGILEKGESSCDPGAGKGYGLEKPECDHS